MTTDAPALGFLDFMRMMGASPVDRACETEEEHNWSSPLWWIFITADGERVAVLRQSYRAGFCIRRPLEPGVEKMLRYDSWTVWNDYRTLRMGF